MNREAQRHQEIRENIVKILRGCNLEPMVSHEKDGEDVRFYHVSEAHPKVHLADPDILVRDGNRFLAIEIEMSVSPKHLFGVAMAISQCNHYRFKTEDMVPMGELSFLLIIESDEMHKYGSHRAKQAKFIEDTLQRMPGFKFAHIVGDKDVESKVKEWLKGGK